jgi:hypothetical protein
MAMIVPLTQTTYLHYTSVSPTQETMVGALSINLNLLIPETVNRARIVPLDPACAAAKEAATREGLYSSRSSLLSTPPDSPTPLDHGAENERPLPDLIVPKDSDIFVDLKDCNLRLKEGYPREEDVRCLRPRRPGGGRTAGFWHSRYIPTGTVHSHSS